MAELLQLAGGKSEEPVTTPSASVRRNHGFQAATPAVTQSTAANGNWHVNDHASAATATLTKHRGAILLEGDFKDF